MFIIYIEEKNRKEGLKMWAQILGQIALNAIPLALNTIQNAQQTYQERVKAYNDILMQDLQHKRQKENELFQKLTESNQERKNEIQEDFASAWSKALNSSE